MPRYRRLGVSKNTDRDTCLFQGVSDPTPMGGIGVDLRNEQPIHRDDNWAPSLRRVHSSRERLEHPTHKPYIVMAKAEDTVVDKHVELEEQRSSSSPPPVSFLRRARSSREAQQQQHDFWSRCSAAAAAATVVPSSAHHQLDQLGPLEAAVQRAMSSRSRTPEKHNDQKQSNGFFSSRNHEEQQQGNGYHAKSSSNGLAHQIASLPKLPKQIKQPMYLPRTQSMRYNRIVSSDNDEDHDHAPPRHSSFTGLENGSLHKGFAAAANGDYDIECKKMVVVSASYQTKEGEILSIECAQCGRWLGTVAQRVTLNEGSLKLCQICHPVDDLKADHHHAAGSMHKAAVAGAAAGHAKKGSSFIRGLRRMLGLKKKS